MSYFMTTAGPWLDLSDLSPVELIRAEEAQYYIRDLGAFLAQADGEPVYLVHDGETGTSHDFIVNTFLYFGPDGRLADCTLLRLLTRLCEAGHVFRIWYASDGENVHAQLLPCHSLEEVVAAIEMYTDTNEDIQLRYAGSSRP
jgi:hypothetical protein